MPPLLVQEELQKCLMKITIPLFAFFSGALLGPPPLSPPNLEGKTDGECTRRVEFSAATYSTTGVYDDVIFLLLVRFVGARDTRNFGILIFSYHRRSFS